MMFEKIVNKANDIIMVADVSGTDGGFRISYVNEAFTRTFGYVGDEVIGQSPRMLQGPDTCAATVEEISAAVHQGVSMRRKLLNYVKGGRKIWLEVNIVPMKNPEGVVISFASIERDVTADVDRELALEDLALTDFLTRAGNRRYFDQTLEREVSRARQLSQPLALGLLDIDHFKAVNDASGHQAGDLVLVDFAGVLRRQLRNYDHVARLGGDEFALILPSTDPLGVQLILERICSHVRAHVLAIDDQQSIRITCSAGFATLSGWDDTVASLVERADRALYKAKAEGRDRVRVAA